MLSFKQTLQINMQTYFSYLLKNDYDTNQLSV